MIKSQLYSQVHSRSEYTGLKFSNKIKSFRRSA